MNKRKVRTRADVEGALGTLFFAWTPEGHVAAGGFFDDVARRLPQYGGADIRVVGPWWDDGEQGELLARPIPDGIVYALDPCPEPNHG